MFSLALSPQNVAVLLGCKKNQIKTINNSKMIIFKKKLRKRADMWSVVFWMGETNVNKKTHDDQYYEIIRGQT